MYTFILTIFLIIYIINQIVQEKFTNIQNKTHIKTIKKEDTKNNQNIQQKTNINKDIKPKLNKKYISAIILNYNRPTNLKNLLPKLSKYENINEIIVSHGNPKYYTEFKYDKVKNYKHYDINKKYGGATRFFIIDLAKNNIILFLDDDILPSEEFINTMYNKLISNYDRNTIYGHTHFIRGCKKNGYNCRITGHKNPFVLTGLSLMKKNIIQDYFKIAFIKYKSWLLKYKGNCEDLSLNIFIRDYYKETPVALKGKITELVRAGGYSSNKNHYSMRNVFCKIFSPFN